jgi:hypothetical protein
MPILKIANCRYDTASLLDQHHADEEQSHAA